MTSSRRLGYALVAVLVALALGYGVTDTAIGWLIPLAALGGGLIGVALIAMRSRNAPASFSADSFHRDRPFDVMNIAHVRVAGLGGAGLLIVAGVTAVQFDLTKVAFIAGITGGVMTGVAMILLRRRRAS